MQSGQSPKNTVLPKEMQTVSWKHYLNLKADLFKNFSSHIKMNSCLKAIERLNQNEPSEHAKVELNAMHSIHIDQYTYYQKTWAQHLAALKKADMAIMANKYEDKEPSLLEKLNIAIKEAKEHLIIAERYSLLKPEELEKHQQELATYELKSVGELRPSEQGMEKEYKQSPKQSYANAWFSCWCCDGNRNSSKASEFMRYKLMRV